MHASTAICVVALAFFASSVVSQAPTPTPTPTRVAVPGFQCPGYANVDFVGNDIANRPGPQSTCCLACRGTVGCAAYSWSDYNNGTCWLKSDAGEVVENSAVQSATNYCSEESYSFVVANTDYPGNDIGNKPGKNSGACCTLCKSTSGCQAYTWTNYNGGTCWLKSAATKPVYYAGAASATLAKLK